jgi:hypothetical protein
MNLKQLALVAALSSIASYASALTPIADSDLSKVSGRDGVSIAADLHVNIGEFKYTDTDAAGGSVRFQGINVTGALAATIDIVNNETFRGEVSAFNADGTVNTATTLGVIPQFADPAGTVATGKSTGLAAFAPKGDVVKIAIPMIDTTKNLAMTVDAIKMGGSEASFGKMEMKDIKLQGTTVYIWAH